TFNFAPSWTVRQCRSSGIKSTQLAVPEPLRNLNMRSFDTMKLCEWSTQELCEQHSRVRGEAAAGAIATHMQAQSIIRASQAALRRTSKVKRAESYAGMGYGPCVLAC
ncbi:hypothetical protein TGAM01_v207442, partial [Trichoderma gamsii]